MKSAADTTETVFFYCKFAGSGTRFTPALLQKVGLTEQVIPEHGWKNVIYFAEVEMNRIVQQFFYGRNFEHSLVFRLQN